MASLPRMKCSSSNSGSSSFFWHFRRKKNISLFSSSTFSQLKFWFLKFWMTLFTLLFIRDPSALQFQAKLVKRRITILSLLSRFHFIFLKSLSFFFLFPSNPSSLPSSLIYLFIYSFCFFFILLSCGFAYYVCLYT